MSNYYDYLDKRTAPKSTYTRPLLKVVQPQRSWQPNEPEIPMTVEESTASDTIIARVKAFWQQ